MQRVACTTIRSFRARLASSTRCLSAPTPSLFLPNESRQPKQNILQGIDLVVCDMAGTTVQEGGIVYQTLRRVMVEHGLDVSEAAMGPWHGARKESVIEHFARNAGCRDVEATVEVLSKKFEVSIDDAYFSDNAKIGPIDDRLMVWFQQLRASGIKIGLDTGYPRNIQEGLIQKLGFTTAVDSYISSYDVPEGRPYPYMIHTLMERLGVADVRRVAKVGDSVRDIEMGRNAGCGLVVGVLSGADKAEELFAAGADLVVDVVTDLPAPQEVHVVGVAGLSETAMAQTAFKA